MAKKLNITPVSSGNVCVPNNILVHCGEIYSKFDELSIHEYATHPIQTLIELAHTEEEIALITSSLSTNTKILKVSLNPNGSYVIQKIISNIPEEKRQNFLEDLKEYKISIYTY